LQLLLARCRFTCMRRLPRARSVHPRSQQNFHVHSCCNRAPNSVWREEFRRPPPRRTPDSLVSGSMQATCCPRFVHKTVYEHGSHSGSSGIGGLAAQRRADGAPVPQRRFSRGRPSRPGLQVHTIHNARVLPRVKAGVPAAYERQRTQSSRFPWAQDPQPL
jgi:hypothetical protein